VYYVRWAVQRDGSGPIQPRRGLRPGGAWHGIRPSVTLTPSAARS